MSYFDSPPPLSQCSYANGPDTALYALYAYGLAAKTAIAAALAILLHGQMKLAQVG